MKGQLDLLTSKEAAKFLGCAEITLRVSRMNGELFGVVAPPFKKMRNGRIYYSKATLEQWLENLDTQEYLTTAEAALSS